MSDKSKMEQKALECPVCKSNKAMIAGENVKLSGKFEDKEFLTTELTILKCTKCGFYMLFDKMAQFTTQEESKSWLIHRLNSSNIFPVFFILKMFFTH